MQSCGDQLFIGFEKICAIAMVGKPFNCLKSPLAVLIDQLPQTKPSTLPTVESTATQIQHFDFFSDRAAEFIDLNKGASLSLRLVDW